MKRLTTTIVLLLLTVPLLLAQRMFTVHGTVSDSLSGKPLARVSIAAQGSGVQGVATVTNDQGQFLLKVPGGQLQSLTVSMLGYKSRRIRLGSDAGHLKIVLQPSSVTLDEIIVRADEAERIVRLALSKVADNYSREPVLYKGFYRETVQKRRQFISISEAVVDMYKTSYTQDIDREAVAITRGRRLLNMKSADTLGVKIMGGPMLPIMADVVKNSELLFYAEDMPCYRFELGVPEKLDDRLQYVVHMTPRQPRSYALYCATLYIDQQTLAFTRAELSLDMSRRQPAVAAMLVSKPSTLRFHPRELSFHIDYRTEDGVTYLSYVRNTMRFTCDWRRRLFASAFTTVSEFVVTDRQCSGKPCARPSRGLDTFSRRDKLYDCVEYFSDPDFWGPDNIIEPTETLDKAIERLKKRVTATEKRGGG